MRRVGVCRRLEARMESGSTEQVQRNWTTLVSHNVQKGLSKLFYNV